jgi:hypothetical protein
VVLEAKKIIVSNAENESPQVERWHNFVVSVDSGVKKIIVSSVGEGYRLKIRRFHATINEPQVDKEILRFVPPLIQSLGSSQVPNFVI